MLVPQRQQSAINNQSRTVIGAPQSGHAHMSTSPCSHNIVFGGTGADLATDLRSDDASTVSRPARAGSASTAEAGGSNTSGSGVSDVISTRGTESPTGTDRRRDGPDPRSIARNSGWSSACKPSRFAMVMFTPPMSGGGELRNPLCGRNWN